jgi:integrase
MSKNEPLRKVFPRVRQLYKDGAQRFVCDSRKKGYPLGKQEWFSSATDALNRAREIADSLVKGNILTDEERTQFLYYKQLFAATSWTMTEALDKAYRYATNKAERNESTETISDIVKLWIAFKRKGEFSAVRPVTLREIEHTGKVITARWGGLKIESLTKDHIETFIGEMECGYATKKNWRVKVSGFLNWCIAQGYRKSNPAKYILIKSDGTDLPRIVEFAQVVKMLEIAQNEVRFRPLINYCAVGFFAGLRPFEINRTSWGNITLRDKPTSDDFGEKWGDIHVTREATKTKTPRYVPICTTLARFLHAYRDVPIYPKKNFRRLFTALRERVGYEFNSETGGLKWPPDGMRHSYASFWLAVHKNKPALAEYMGNSVDVIRRHYSKGMPVEEAEPYWKISPVITLNPYM